MVFCISEITKQGHKGRRMKISPTQLEVLKELSKEGVILHYMRYIGSFNPNSYWFISDSMKRVRCSTADVLIKEQLIKVTFTSLGYKDTAQITSKGRSLVIK